MKLNLELLKKFIDLPENDPKKVRPVLDELGLEVDAIEELNGAAVFNIETLANRGDHLCALGVAREFSARYLIPYKLPEVAELKAAGLNRKLSIQTERCFLYELSEIELASNVSAINEIKKFLEPGDSELPAAVQISNYLLQEIGQPTHAFDADLVEGDLYVTLSEKEEEVLALDNQKYKVPANSILICDSKKIIAVAGVIGLANSMVSSATKRVLLESACFCPITVRKTGRAMGLSTDASYLFERGSDPAAATFATARFLKLSEGKLLGRTQCGEVPAAMQISLQLSRIITHTNIKGLKLEDVVQRLQALGYKVVKNHSEDFIVLVPSWRKFNVMTEASVVEDFCRAYGFNNLELELPALDPWGVAKSKNETIIDLVEPVLLGSGFNEVITRSYYSSDDVRMLSSLKPEAAEEHVRIINSMEGAYSNLRLTNIINFSKLAERNIRTGAESIKVYEFCRLFKAKGFPDSPYAREIDVLTLGLAGRFNDNIWRRPESTEELISQLSGTVQDLLRTLKIKFSMKPGSNPYLHPGQQVEFFAGVKYLGDLGVVHPAIKEKLKLSKDLIYCVLYLPRISAVIGDNPRPQIVDFPLVRRDVTLKVPPKTFAIGVSHIIQGLRPANLKSVDIVDSFKKKEEDFSRVSYRLTFQNPDRTLESAEVDREMKTLLDLLSNKFNYHLAN